MTLEDLIEKRAKLASQMLRGESAIEFEQRRTEFRSYDEMAAQLAWIDNEIAGLTGVNTGLTRVRVVSTDKDL
jgi:hypothetical protein